MTDGPRRLNKSGGISQRLLDSASLDKPSHNSRRMAANLASTASSFASSRPANAAVARPPSTVRTLATWIAIGAAASVTLGLVGGTLLDPTPAPRAAAPLLTAPSPAPRAVAASPDISPEPAAPANLAPKPAPAAPVANAAPIEPWVPSPLAIAPTAAPATGAPKPSSASFEEVREIEAARAAVSRGDTDGAVAALDEYDSSHANGQLKPESMALRIQVLSNSGKATEARTLANEFEGKYPAHPLAERVRGGVSK